MSLIECLFRSEWMENAQDFCHMSCTLQSTQESDEDEAVEMVDDILKAHRRLITIHSDSSGFASSDDD